jgi:oligoendopeptidase F
MNTPPKQGLRQAQRNALQRIEELETNLMNVFGAVQQALNGSDQRVNALAEILDAVVAELGPETINTRVVEGRKARALEQAEKSKAALAEAVEKGQYKAVEVITDKTLIVGKELDKEGKEVFPGYVQLAYSSIKPEFQEKLLGKGVGASFETESGKFDVTGTYEAVEAPVAPEVAEGQAQ